MPSLWRRVRLESLHEMQRPRRSGVCPGCEAFRRLGNAKQSASGAWGRHTVREYAHSSKATGEHNNGCISSKRPPKRFRCKAVRRALMQQLWEAILAEPETETTSAQQAIRPAGQRLFNLRRMCNTRTGRGGGRWNYKVERVTHGRPTHQKHAMLAEMLLH